MFRTVGMVRHRLPSFAFHRSLSESLLFCSSLSFSTYPDHTVVGMPSLSPTMTSGTISQWNFAPGDSFIAGDSLAEVQTDKASIDFESTDDGVMGLQFVKEGVEVQCGVPICITIEEGEDYNADDFKDYIPEAGVGGRDGHSPVGSTTMEEAVLPSLSKDAQCVPTVTVDEGLPREHRATVSALFHASSSGMDALSLFPGTGKGGRVTKGDVLFGMKNSSILPLGSNATTRAMETPAVPPSQAKPSTSSPMPAYYAPYDGSSTFTDEAPSQMRKVIASRLTESKRDTPHFYIDSKINIDNLLSLRKEIFAATGGKVSVNDLVVKCAGMALRDVQKVNHPADDDNIVDVSVAVATPAGLITPIVQGVDCMGLTSINNKIAELAG